MIQGLAYCMHGWCIVSELLMTKVGIGGQLFDQMAQMAQVPQQIKHGKEHLRL